MSGLLVIALLISDAQAEWQVIYFLVQVLHHSAEHHTLPIIHRLPLHSELLICTVPPPTHIPIKYCISVAFMTILSRAGM